MLFILFALVATVVCFVITMLIRHGSVGWGSRPTSSDVPEELPSELQQPHVVDAQSAADMGRTIRH
jgi:hypothetical protein